MYLECLLSLNTMRIETLKLIYGLAISSRNLSKTHTHTLVLFYVIHRGTYL